LEFIITFTWIILLTFHIACKRKQFSQYIIDPIFLFFIGQIVFLILLGIVNHTGYLRPAEQFSFASTFYLLTFGLSFFMGSFILDRPKNKMFDKNIIKYNTQIIIKFSFYICFVIGFIGTLVILKSFYHGSLLRLLPYFFANFNEFDKYFPRSHAMVLWQANFAVLFWSAFRKDNWVKFIVIFIAAINILFRAAFLYVVVAAFYFLVPTVILAKKRYFILLFVFVLVLMPLINYPISIGNIKRMLISITPYTFGNFINYNIYFNEMYLHNNICFDFVDVFRRLGFGSIMFYMDKYLGTDFLKHIPPAPFYNQLQDYIRYGNLASFYARFTKLPYLLGIFYCFFLGLLNRFVYNHAFKSLFFLSIYSWFAAASFMSFAGTGYFASTRFIPAILYIWPFLLIIWLSNVPISHRKW